MVRQWQELFYERSYVATGYTGNPDFVKLAEAFGVFGARVTGQVPGEARDTERDGVRRAGHCGLRGGAGRERLSDDSVRHVGQRDDRGADGRRRSAGNMVTTNGSQSGHTITALVEDKPGVLNRITSMFRRRGYNIASLAVGPSEVPNLSRMTFVVDGDPRTVEQVAKNLNKLIDVIKVVDVSDEYSVRRELALIRVRANVQTRSEIMQIVDIFRANIVDVAPESLIVEVIGDEDKVDALIELLRSFSVQEVMRTGTVAMSRGMDGAPTSGRRLRASGWRAGCNDRY